MKNFSTECKAAVADSRRNGWETGDERHWTIGIAVTVAAVALVAAAVAAAPASVRANNSGCLEQLANDEHASLEAFFQNPAQQDALVQAITVCSR